MVEVVFKKLYDRVYDILHRLVLVAVAIVRRRPPQQTQTQAQNSISSCQLPWDITQTQTQTQNETQNSIISLCELPRDIIKYSIAVKLALFDYWNLRATCKMFKAELPPEPEWRTPLFIHFKEDKDEEESYSYEVKELFRDISCSRTLTLTLGDHHHHHHIHIAHLNLNRIMASTKNGWLLVKSKDENLQFVNVFRNMGFATPRLKRGIVQRVILAAFSKHDPTSHDCVIVAYCHKTTSYVGRRHCIAYRYSSSITWKYYDLEETFSNNYYNYPTSVVYHNEAFYFLDKHGYVGVFKKLFGQEASWTFCGKQVDINKADACFRPISSYLIEFDGDLLLPVFTGETSDGGGGGGRRRGVLKVFGYNNKKNKKKWVEVKSLGNCSLFIGPTSFAVLTRGRNNIIRNNIYLPRMLDHDSMLYYSLKTHTGYALVGRKTLFKCCWV